MLKWSVNSRQNLSIEEELLEEEQPGYRAMGLKGTVHVILNKPLSFRLMTCSTHSL